MLFSNLNLNTIPKLGTHFDVKKTYTNKTIYIDGIKYNSTNENIVLYII
jgi:hypothetical protein